MFDNLSRIKSHDAGVLADLDPPGFGPPGPNPLEDMDPPVQIRLTEFCVVIQGNVKKKLANGKIY